MKNIKMFIVGLIIGLSIVLGVYAVEYVINPNPYPVIVNGQQQDIQALNIDGFTYMKLADAAKVLNASVKFNEVDKQIEINQNATATATATIYNVGETITSGNYEITLNSVTYQEYPPIEKADRSHRYFTNPDYHMVLVDYTLKNITDHDVSLPGCTVYLDYYKEKRLDTVILANMLKFYSPEYCKENNIGYGIKYYVKAGETINIKLDYPIKKLDTIKHVTINGIDYKI